MMDLHALVLTSGLYAGMWALFLALVDGNSLMASQSLGCAPEEVSSYLSGSSISCAMRCSTLHGMAFIYKDGTCDVYGPSQVDFSGQERLFRRLISPPPGPLEEVSRGKPSEATANYPSFYPHNAVDDSDSTMYHSANGIARAWWMIDLLQHRLVRAVEVLPRYDFAPAVGRFHDVEIRVSSTPRNGEDFSSWNLIGQYAGPYTAAEWRLNFTHDIGICGRYVVVQKVSSDTDHLQIVDVRVYVAPMMTIL